MADDAFSDARRERAGSCLCGAVRYRLSAAPLGINLCHCRQCRKASGTAFASNAAIPRDAFHIDAGADSIAQYASSEGKRRHFCGRCGSPLFSSYDADSSVVYVRIGTLDDDDSLTPDVHIHVASKAPWHEIHDALPRREEQEDLWF